MADRNEQAKPKKQTYIVTSQGEKHILSADGWEILIDEEGGKLRFATGNVTVALFNKWDNFTRGKVQV